MKSLGMFANDRELLECPRCGLMEDVAAGGMFLTVRPTDLGTDTGLRFQRRGRGAGCLTYWKSFLTISLMRVEAFFFWTGRAFAAVFS